MRLSHLFACINSSANFLIYYVKGTKFRRAWVQTYSPIYEAIFPMCMVSNNNSEVEAPETNEGEKAFTKKVQMPLCVLKVQMPLCVLDESDFCVIEFTSFTSTQMDFRQGPEISLEFLF